MRIGVVILMNLFAVVSMAIADETLPVLKAGNDTYTHVTIFKTNATDIFFTSDKGLGNAKLKDLDPQLQKHFNFNPTNAAAIEQKHKADNALYYQQVSRPSFSQNSTAGQIITPDSQTEPGTGKQIWARPILNQDAPSLSIEKWLTPRPDGRGKFTIIDFWATWCEPCRAAIPELNYFQKKFADRLVVIGISDESEDTVRKMTDPQIEYSVAIDTQARTKNELQVTGIPHLIVIDPHGIVRWEGFPFLKGHELSEQVLLEILNKYNN